jgi:hypothetical protein
MVTTEEYDIPLDNACMNMLRVIKTYEKGLVNLVVVYYTIRGGEKIPLITYDMAHGFPHRDIRYLEDKDKRKKKEINVEGLEDFLNTAIEDITGNWRRYLKEFRETEK